MQPSLVLRARLKMITKVLQMGSKSDVHMVWLIAQAPGQHVLSAGDRLLSKEDGDDRE